jgi:hypothetical protein
MWGWPVAGGWPGIVWRTSTAAAEEISRKLLFSPGHASPMLRAMRVESWWGVGLGPEHSLIVSAGPVKVMAGLSEGGIIRLWMGGAVWWGCWHWAHTWRSSCHWPLVNDAASVCRGWGNRWRRQMASAL